MNFFNRQHPTLLFSVADSLQSPIAQTECDCSPDERLLPRITNLIECDCSPDDRLRPQAVPDWQGQALALAPVIWQRLAGGVEAAYAPLSAGGVSVLNPAARQALAGFSRPRPAMPAERPLAQQLLRAGLLRPADGRPAFETRPHGDLLSAWLHVTDRCNLACDYCYVPKRASGMTLETGRAAVDAVLRSALAGGFKAVKLKFAGGEPTLRLPLVFAVDDYARRQAAVLGLHIDTVLLSNGVSLPEAAIRQMQASGMRLMISLDGDAPAQDAQRRRVDGRGSFEQVAATLDRLAAAGLTPFISLTLTGRSAERLPQSVGMLLSRDLPFNINFYRPGEADPQTDLLLDQARIIGALQAALAEIEAQLPDYSLLGMLIDRARLDHPHDRACAAGSAYMAIDGQGRVAPCHMLLHQPLSDIHATDPLAALSGERSGLHNLSVDRRPDCAACPWRYGCGGGCPVLTQRHNARRTGRDDARSPYCGIYQAIYPQLVRLEAVRLLRQAGIPYA